MLKNDYKFVMSVQFVDVKEVCVIITYEETNNVAYNLSQFL